MCHLYDIDSDLKPIKHTQFKHDSVQEAMAVAQAEYDVYGETIKWESEFGITQGFIDNTMVYEIVE